MHELTPEGERWGAENLFKVSAKTANELGVYVVDIVGTGRWASEVTQHMGNRHTFLKGVMPLISKAFNFNKKEDEYFRHGYLSAFWLLAETASRKKDTQLPSPDRSRTMQYRGRVETLLELDAYDEYRDEIDAELAESNPEFLDVLEKCLNTTRTYGTEEKYAFFVGAITVYDLLRRQAVSMLEKEKEKWIKEYGESFHDKKIVVSDAQLGKYLLGNPKPE